MQEFTNPGPVSGTGSKITYALAGLIVAGLAVLAVFGSMDTAHGHEMNREAVYESAQLSDVELGRLSIDELTAYHDAATEYEEHDGNRIISTILLERLSSAIHAKDGQ